MIGWSAGVLDRGREGVSEGDMDGVREEWME